ncbi:DUF3857 domain-containing protein [Aridibaculum aurantiacum]|uniref:DUF3857 domain-containing protein n=1 Tax=Aridibaculum aurantiacum TaxID=2810307 RepID=UPI001A960C3E|nr:DUF3857 domain-containing protein [Aridibaculum aurantiacum]
MTAPAKKSVLLLMFSAILSLSVLAERPKMKFGDISVSDFEPKSYPIDPSADAVVLGHFGEVTYEGNNHGYLSIVYRKHLRIRVMNRNGFDAATIGIRLYLGGGGIEEKIDKLEAATYNLVDGKVEASKLDNKSLFKDKVTKSYHIQKFTMPNLQEGSIIDVRYTVTSPFPRVIDPWSFQGEYPRLYTEYAVSIPEWYDFMVLSQGYHPYASRDVKKTIETYNLYFDGGAGAAGQTARYTANVTTTTMAMENVPALKQENFTTTLDNHISKVSFQLSRYNPPGGISTPINNNWFAVSNNLLKSPDFGEELSGNLNWLKSDLQTIVGSSTENYDKAKAIYNYVKNGFTCSSHRGLYKTNSLKKIFQSKSGTVADINLLLTAMLSAQGFSAQPVILSTRDNGVLYEAYPMLERLNYVVTRVQVDDKTYLLDASYRNLGFGTLPAFCYNGGGRLIDKMPVIVNLSPDSLIETRIASINLIADGPGKLNGSYTSKLGVQESYNSRERLATVSKDDFFSAIKKAYPGEMSVTDPELEGLTDYEEPLTVKYNLSTSFSEDVVYLNPLFTEAKKDNPFKAAERLYPIEMPYAINDIVAGRIDIPEGYEVDEMPKSTRVMYNENEGMFEYLLVKNGSSIQLRSTLKLNKANFLPEDYASLRDFFGYVVKCHSEQIVLKKIKK